MDNPGTTLGTDNPGDVVNFVKILTKLYDIYSVP